MVLSDCEPQTLAATILSPGINPSTKQDSPGIVPPNVHGMSISQYPFPLGSQVSSRKANSF